MSFNKLHHLKPEKLKEVIIYGCNPLGNRVPIDSYSIPANEDEPASFIGNQVGHFINSSDATLVKRKRQTGGIISYRNFSPTKPTS